MITWWQLKEDWLKPIVGALLLPYILYREIKEQIDLWNTKGHTPFAGKGGEGRELKALVDRLGLYREDASQRRETLSQGIVVKLFTDPFSPAGMAAYRLLSEIIKYEGFLTVPDIDLKGRKLSTSEVWETAGQLSRILDTFEKPEVLQERLEKLLRAILSESDLCLRERQEGEDTELAVPLYVLLPDAAQAVQRALGEMPRFSKPLCHLVCLSARALNTPILSGARGTARLSFYNR